MCLLYVLRSAQCLKMRCAKLFRTKTHAKQCTLFHVYTNLSIKIMYIAWHVFSFERVSHNALCTLHGKHMSSGQTGNKRITIDSKNNPTVTWHMGPTSWLCLSLNAALRQPKSAELRSKQCHVHEISP